MKIYNQEILDGLSQSIASKTVASCIVDVVRKNNKAVAKNANVNQPDLFYIDDCILVSTVWNLNDDVFTAEEVLKARTSPVDKQFNYMHDDTFIIGHITSADIVDLDGNKIEKDFPEVFDISISSVLYTKYSNEDKQKTVSKLIAEIPEGKWFVSMECLFADFDYAVVAPDNTQKVIARNEESSFLTKHLRGYGGTGVYQNYKIGRVLKNIVFSGVGLVDNPANPRSEIKSFSFNGAQASIKEFSEVLMSQELKTASATVVDTVTKAQYDELKSELSQFKEVAAKATQKEIEASKAEVATLQSEVSKAKEDLANATKLSNDKTAKIEALEAELVTVAKKLEDAQAEISKAQEDKKVQARISKLVEVGVDSAKAASLVEKFATASDEMFDEVVSLNKAAKKEDKPMDDEETEDKKATEKSKCSIDLDKVVAEKSVIPQDNTQQDTAAKASAYFAKVLSNTKKK